MPINSRKINLPWGDLGIKGLRAWSTPIALRPLQVRVAPSPAVPQRSSTLSAEDRACRFATTVACQLELHAFTYELFATSFAVVAAIVLRHSPPIFSSSLKTHKGWTNNLIHLNLHANVSRTEWTCTIHVTKMPSENALACIVEQSQQVRVHWVGFSSWWTRLRQSKFAQVKASRHSVNRLGSNHKG